MHSLSPARRIDPQLLPHLFVMGLIMMGTLVLAYAPHWVMQADYRSMLQTLFGIRCPFCGMTRDFAAMLHGGQPSLNPCSGLAALIVYGVYPIGVLAAWRTGRLAWFHSKAARGIVGMALGVMIVANNWH
jgi:Protein of unknown function (DUF2752)